jgi:hypothetical protein
MSFILSIFDFFRDLYNTYREKFIEIFLDVEFHYGCPNSKRIEKLNLKRQNYN